MNAIAEIQKWFHLQYDGNWEHHHGITIETCDNPGWLIAINLKDTPL
jgi:hypothetical protein